MADEETTETGETTPPPVAETKEPDTFSREYVEELRKENANYRTRAKSYEDVFDGYDEDAKAAILNFASNFKEDQVSAASEMKELVDTILAQQEAEGVEKGNEDYLSPAQVQKMIDEKLQAVEATQALRELEAEAKSLGYNPNSEDEDERLDYLDLCEIALKTPEHDLEEAHKRLQARKQKIVDGYLKSKEADAGKTPKAPVANGSTASQEKDLDHPKTIEDVEARAIARLEAANTKI